MYDMYSCIDKAVELQQERFTVPNLQAAHQRPSISQNKAQAVLDEARLRLDSIDITV